MSIRIASLISAMPDLNQAAAAEAVHPAPAYLLHPLHQALPVYPETGFVTAATQACCSRYHGYGQHRGAGASRTKPGGGIGITLAGGRKKNRPEYPGVTGCIQRVLGAGSTQYGNLSELESGSN